MLIFFIRKRIRRFVQLEEKKEKKEKLFNCKRNLFLACRLNKTIRKRTKV